MALYEDIGRLLTGKAGLTAGNPESIARANQMIADATKKAQQSGSAITGYRRSNFTFTNKAGSQKKYLDVPVFGLSEEERLGPIRAEQQRLAGIQQKQFETQQADIASQLKILQGEKSAVSKAQETYSNMLIAEAQRKKKAEEQAARDLQTQRANQAMAGRSGSLQIQPAGGAPRMGGTSQFRRRALQQGTASPYKGLSTIKSGMVNP